MNDIPSTGTVRFARGVIRWRIPILVATLALLFPLASGMQHLSFDTDYRAFFSKSNPQLEAFEELQAVYTKNDNIIIAVEPASGNVFERETLAAVEWLTHEAWKLPYTIRVDALTNFQHTWSREDDLVVEDLFEDAGSLTDAQVAAKRQVALSEPLLRDRLVREEGRMTSVNATLQLPGEAITEVPEAAAAARDLAARFERKFPGHATYLTGTTMLNNAFSEAGIADMQGLMPFVYLGMLFVMYLLLRSLSGTLTTLLIIAFSAMAAMGFAGWIGIRLTPPSATAPTMIMTLAVADSIHILVTMLREMRRGVAKNDAIVESLRINMQPVFLTSLTTAIGFLSMNFSDVPPFQHLGNITAFGVGMAFVLSVTFLPAVISILPVRVKAVETQTRPGIMERFAEIVIARRRPLLLASIAAVALFAALIPMNELNDQFVSYFDPRIQFRTDTDHVSDNLTGIYQVNYSIGAGESGGISDPGYLAKLDAFAEWFRARPKATHVNSFSDTMKRLNKNLHGDDDAYYRTPRERDLAAQYLLLYEMSLPFGLDLNDQINVDKSATRFIVTLENMTSNEIQGAAIAGEDWLRDNGTPSMASLGSSTAVMFSYITARNVRAMLRGTFFAMLLIAGALLIALRSVKFGSLSLIPNVVPAILGFGLWGLLVGEIGLSLSVVSVMTLGIVVDDTVHFISKYMRARREKNLGPEDAVRYAFSSVGWALVVTTAILTAGFAVLSFSAFKLNSGMGQLTAIVIVFALIADFTLLPAILMSWSRRRAKQPELEEGYSHEVSPSEA